MHINIHDYTYTLPPGRIAQYPLPQRDESKLLVYKKGEITHSTFRSLPDFLPANTFLFFNNTKVIPARLLFQKATGASIEIFLLNPVKPSALVAEAMLTKNKTRWKCTIGNLKRWVTGTVLTKEIDGITLQATLIDREQGVVELNWNTEHSFAELLTRSGETPLPPYLNRQAETADRERYQTIYSHHEGAVAAPTAGLHFTNNIFHSLQHKNIGHDYLTLHVSAGTFQPIKVENAWEHTMHNEQVVITRKNLENLLQDEKCIIAVGTTALRSLESLYWYGVKLLQNPGAEFRIYQDDPYLYKGTLPTREQALQAIAAHMDSTKMEQLFGSTSIYIVPGYAFQICQGLITNFHQPGSTLMLLVAALTGKDWKKIYDEALANNYRFLSYGDSSLLIP